MMVSGVEWEREKEDEREGTNRNLREMKYGNEGEGGWGLECAP
jgi:hypothetical protein